MKSYRRFFIKSSLNDIRKQELSKAIKRYLTQKGLKEVSTVKDADIVFSIGGDGTILSLVRDIILTGEKKLPLIFGVNAGKLGFLTASEGANWKEDVDRFLRGDFRVEKRFLLEGLCGDKHFFALNEVAVFRKGPRILGIKVFLDGDEMAYFKGDGFIVSTPTGSTAYSLAAGGPIVEPHTRVMICTPICPHTLSARPVVVSDNHSVGITVDGMAQVSSDGQMVCEVSDDDTLRVFSSERFIKVVSFGRSFFATLEEKMGWKRG